MGNVNSNYSSMQGRVMAHFEKSKNRKPNKNPLMEIFLKSLK